MVGWQDIPVDVGGTAQFLVDQLGAEDVEAAGEDGFVLVGEERLAL